MDMRRASVEATRLDQRARDPFGANDDRHFGGADEPGNPGGGGYNTSGPGAAPGGVGGNGGGNFGGSRSNSGDGSPSNGGGRADTSGGPSTAPGHLGGGGGNQGHSSTSSGSGTNTSGGPSTAPGHLGGGGGNPGSPRDHTATENRRPVILDLDGNGFDLDPLSSSSFYADLNGDGQQTRMAWAGAGTGVLMIDADGDGKISQEKEFAFTKWDVNAKGDMEAIKNVFDTNDNGRLDAGDAAFADFKIERVNTDGSTTVLTLAQAGITSINLTADATRIELPDGSMITGQTIFTRSNGAIGTVANVSLMAEVQGYAVTQNAVTDAAGTRTVTSSAYNTDGSLAFVYKSVTATRKSGSLATMRTNRFCNSYRSRSAKRYAIAS